MDQDRTSHYIVLSRPDLPETTARELWRYLYPEPPALIDMAGFEDYLFRKFADRGFLDLIKDEAFRLAAMPLRNWQLSILGEPIARDEPLDQLVLPFTLRDDAALEQLEAFLRECLGADKAPVVGADLPLQVSEHWCPSDAADPVFGTRTDAGRLFGVEALQKASATGKDVNVVVVDRGVDSIPLGSSVAGGWTAHGTFTSKPGSILDQFAGGHGTMVARNVRQAAPDARIWDCRLIPPAIGDKPTFLSQAHDALIYVLADIKGPKLPKGPWVFVNAWGVFSSVGEKPPGSYTAGINHPFNKLFRAISALGFDAVFAAGNCGQFCPSRRCGPQDRGPGRSILGVNSHPDVLSVGAVRTDALWLGYSSQGPGKIEPSKPDLCAPSGFREDGDAHLPSTGTSAACGVAAGVVAALRSKYAQSTVSPQQLRKLLRNTAHRPDSAKGWDERLGCGVLNAACALATKVPPEEETA